MLNIVVYKRYQTVWEGGGGYAKTELKQDEIFKACVFKRFENGVVATSISVNVH